LKIIFLAKVGHLKSVTLKDLEQKKSLAEKQLIVLKKQYVLGMITGLSVANATNSLD